MVEVERWQFEDEVPVMVLLKGRGMTALMGFHFLKYMKINICKCIHFDYTGTELQIS